MVDVMLRGAAVLRRAVSWLKEVISMDDTVTFIFNNTDGMSLVASPPPPDHTIFVLLRIHRRSFNLFRVDDEYSFGIDLEHLCSHLDSADDEDYIGFSSLHDVNPPHKIKLTFKFPARRCNPPFQQYIRVVEMKRKRKEIDVGRADEQLMEFYQTPRPYAVRIAIPTPFFLIILSFFSDVKVDTVYVLIADAIVTFAAANKKMVLSRERNEYIIDGVIVESQSPYIAIFSVAYLCMFEEQMRGTDSVRIYPSYPGGLPDALSWSVRPIGEITYFFRDESDDQFPKSEDEDIFEFEFD